jgi:hypothetical protein
MKGVKLSESLAMKLAPAQRRAVELLAEKEQMSLGEAARTLLSDGMEARGLNVEKDRIGRPSGEVVETKPPGREHAQLHGVKHELCLH